jgi:hypothetical protein
MALHRGCCLCPPKNRLRILDLINLQLFCQSISENHRPCFALRQMSTTGRLRLSRASRPMYKYTTRTIFTHVSTLLTPVMVYLGLFSALWTYKCIMLVIFQNKIIYMPYFPPFSRSERIQDYSQACKGVCWNEKHIRSSDRTRISLCIGSTSDDKHYSAHHPRSHVIILYLQGFVSHPMTLFLGYLLI